MLLFCVLGFSLFRLLFQVSANSDRRICRNGNDRNFVRLPLPCDIARAFKTAVRAVLFRFYAFPNENAVPNGNAFKRSGFYLLVNRFGLFVRVKLDFCVCLGTFNPYTVNLSQYVVSVVVKKHNPDFLKASEINGPRRMVQNFCTPAAVVRFLAGKAQDKLSFVPFALKRPYSPFDFAGVCFTVRFPLPGLLRLLWFLCCLFLRLLALFPLQELAAVFHRLAPDRALALSCHK